MNFLTQSRKNLNDNNLRKTGCKTRKHSSRMRTVHLRTIRVSMAATRCQYQGVGPQVNRFQKSPVMTARCQWWGVGYPGHLLGGRVSRSHVQGIGYPGPRSGPGPRSRGANVMWFSQGVQKDCVRC